MTDRHASGEHHRRHPTKFERARRIFLAGILVIIPAFVAIYAVTLIMGLAEYIFGGFIETGLNYLHESLTIKEPLVGIVKTVLSFIAASIMIMMVGWLSTFLLIRRLISIGEAIITRVPLVKFFYNVPKEVITTFAMGNKGNFKRVVMFEYPRRGIWAFGFATAEVRRSPDEQLLIGVFMPTTPNPTSGFLMYLPMDDILDTNLTMEEGARLIISGGILSPTNLVTQKFTGLDIAPKLPPAGALGAPPSVPE